MKQEIKVYALPTEKASKGSIIQFASKNGYYIASEKDALIVNDKPFGDSTGTPHHLYVTTSETPKEGDWALLITTITTVHKLVQINKADLIHIELYKKVVATTDKELGFEDTIRIPQGRFDNVYPTFKALPQISPEFQQAWVREMNNNTPIVDTIMEMEKETLYTDDGLDYKGDLQPKLNPQGYVTILPAKEKMYSREEVINFIDSYVEERDNFGIDRIKWIEQNLS